MDKPEKELHKTNIYNQLAIENILMPTNAKRAGNTGPLSALH
ncbi:hypothetical protein [Thalassospira sp. NFXS8]